MTGKPTDTYPDDRLPLRPTSYHTAADGGSGSLVHAGVVLLGLAVIAGMLLPAIILLLSRAFFRGRGDDGPFVPAIAGGSPARNRPEFTDPRYFWGRLSAQVEPASGPDHGKLNPALVRAANARVAALQAADPANPEPIPADLVTAPPGGFDPDVSIVAVLYQVPRVARARKVGDAEVAALLRQHTAGRRFWSLGEPRVNVVELNAELDQRYPGR